VIGKMKAHVRDETFVIHHDRLAEEVLGKNAVTRAAKGTEHIYLLGKQRKRSGGERLPLPWEEAGKIKSERPEEKEPREIRR